MEKKVIKLIRGAHYTEGYADTFQITMFDNRKYAELLLCEEIPYIADEVILANDNSQDVCALEKSEAQETVANRVVHARFKLSAEALVKLAKLLESVQKDVPQ